MPKSPYRPEPCSGCEALRAQLREVHRERDQLLEEVRLGEELIQARSDQLVAVHRERDQLLEEVRVARSHLRARTTELIQARSEVLPPEGLALLRTSANDAFHSTLAVMNANPLANLHANFNAYPNIPNTFPRSNTVALKIEAPVARMTSWERLGNILKDTEDVKT